MDKWKGHKVVEAGKIARLRTLDNGSAIVDVDDGEEVGIKPEDWKRMDAMRPHEDFVGGYLVKYEDGYLSWSPADAFEKGYSLAVEQCPECKVDLVNNPDMFMCPACKANFC